MLWLVPVAAFGYLVGAIPSGYWLGRRFAGKDVRADGSGNIGATNVARVLGLRWGLLVLVLDMAKGALPVVVSLWLWPTATHGSLQAVGVVALATLVGNCYSVFLRFQGGKGVATASGISLILWPGAILFSFLVFLAVAWRWRYVSLASLSASLTLPLWLALLGYPALAVGLGSLFAICIVVRHRFNIQALIHGTERKWQGR
jgi:glycerol-3-phosphate acyltransferase PlsY